MDELVQIEKRRARGRENQRRWREGHVEQHRAQVAAWRIANPEKFQAITRRRADRLKAARSAKKAERALLREASREERAEKRKARTRAKYHQNRNIHVQRQRLWRERNPGKTTESVRAWRKANPERRRELRKTRKIAKNATTRTDLMKVQRGQCAYCRDQLGPDSHLDHIMPRKLGGTNARANLQLTCPPCNIAKSAHHPVEFAQSLGRLI